MAQSVLEPLAWDSEHFGIHVARITTPCLNDVGLETVLRQARCSGIHLVYWATAGDRELGAALLRKHSGMMVDRKATFLVHDLGAAAGPVSGPAGSREVQIGRGRIRVLELKSVQGEPMRRLVDLAIAAGSYSRFRVDPRIPPAKFEILYDVWIRRSLSGELADAVLIAAGSGAEEHAAGLVTISAVGETGHIGLISVAEEARGQGVGSELLAAAHRWMRSQGLSRRALSPNSRIVQPAVSTRTRATNSLRSRTSITSGRGTPAREWREARPSA